MNAYFASYLFGNETIFFVTSDHYGNNDKVTSKVENLSKNDIIEINKPVLILAKNITALQITFLTKILGSVNISLDHAEIIDIEKTLEFIISKKCQKIIIFGPEANNLNISIPGKYLPFKTETFNYLLSDNLTTLELNANDEKRKLWNALKGFVNI